MFWCGTPPTKSRMASARSAVHRAAPDKRRRLEQNIGKLLDLSSELAQKIKVASELSAQLSAEVSNLAIDFSTAEVSNPDSSSAQLSPLTQLSGTAEDTEPIDVPEEDEPEEWN